MNILFWVSDFPRLSETFIRDQIVGLIKRGHQIFIYSEGNIIDKIDEQALNGFEDYHLLDRIIYLSTIKPKNIFRKLFFFMKIIFLLPSNNGKYYRRLLNNNWIKKSLPFKSRYFFFINFIINHNIEAIHTHFGTNANNNIWIKQLGLPIRHIVTFHGFDIRLGLNDKSKMYKTLFENTDIVIAISKYNKDSLLKMGLHPDKIIEIPNGIDVDFFKRKDEFTSHQTIKMVSVARLVEEKGLVFLFKALNKLKRENSINQHFILKIIGNGPLKNDLLDLIDNLQLKENVFLLGGQDSTAVRDLLISSDLYILSSISEALPTVLLEAQSCELPILATDVGSVKDMLADAVIVKPKSENQLFEGLKELLEIRDRWVKMGQKGRNFVLKNFDNEKTIIKIEKLYKK